VAHTVALAGRSLVEVLEAVAAQTPAPGGGYAAAAASGFAAGLVEMSAQFTLARDRYRDHHERAAAIAERAVVLRAESLELGERELRAFEPVLEVMRSPEAPGRSERLRAALSDAANSPLAIARGAAEVAELAAEIAGVGNVHLAGDAIAGALLAEAACAAAVRLTALNLAELPDDPRLAEAAELARRAADAREQALR
jgi:formiminotetrahydrofolate cyclodeaminase